MKSTIFVASFFLLFSIGFAFSWHDLFIHQIQVNVYYPHTRLCEGCVLLISYDSGLTQSSSGIPETPFSAIDGMNGENNASYILTQDSVNPDLFKMTLYYRAQNVGDDVRVILFYSALSYVSGNLDTLCAAAEYSGVQSQLGGDLSISLHPTTSSVNFYPHFCVESGSVQNIVDGLSVVEEAGPVSSWVYIPPGILENPTPRIVNTLVIVADAQYVSGITTIVEGMILSGSIQETAVVGITTTPDDSMRLKYLTPTACTVVGFPFPDFLGCADICPYGSGGGITHLNIIYNHTLPLISSLYGIETDRQHLAFSGYSAGGLLACQGGYMKSTMASRLHCAAPSFFWNNEEFPHSTLSFNPISNSVNFFITVGGEESGIVPSVQDTINRLKFLGYTEGVNLFTDIREGEVHSISSYVESLVWALPKMFPPQTNQIEYRETSSFFTFMGTFSPFSYFAIK
eukprot:TRINITY_DN810_c0_g2_i4.p1 TRINITY_DN810_c0_g2~~TRINITY_DN810_c0_g2_i4.p1  ORF type:complete len:457 (-),score=90.49 TRINITY_DN810_c0_g2_i4:15-1385(-)